MYRSLHVRRYMVKRALHRYTASICSTLSNSTEEFQSGVLALLNMRVLVLLTLLNIGVLAFLNIKVLARLNIRVLAFLHIGVL